MISQKLTNSANELKLERERERESIDRQINYIKKSHCSFNLNFVTLTNIALMCAQLYNTKNVGSYT